jgi:hypothetical protein
MKLRKLILGVPVVSAAIALVAAAAPAAAGQIVYKATDYTGGKHGLWTNDLKANPGDQYYSFQDDVRFTLDVDNDVATLTGTAINKSGLAASMNLTFTGWLETTQGSTFSYKKEQGLAYNPLTDGPDIDFFTAGSGTIAIDGTTYNLAGSPFVSNYAFQYGVGANGKNTTDFGAASWLSIDGRQKHWDVNFAMTPAVPEPTTWAMMLLGFFGIGATMRGRRTGGKAPAYA